MTMPAFADRADAGRRLAAALPQLAGADAVVLALPRGGVPVAAPVARALGAPLDVIVVRKIVVPRYPELALGAVGEDGVRVANPDVVRAAGVEPGELREATAVAAAQVERRLRNLRAGRPGPGWAGRTVVIVDDGAATGATARAACHVARARGAARVVLALPVAAPGAAALLAGEADEVIVLEQPAELGAVGAWYADFEPTTEEEVAALLADR
ncbi:phosphoribosyltransferase [Actinoplanes sp. NPDC049599]|uniref:phosphoribosyltransferase n=1 Tax=Actinoplanes sp. NPDC049599 TaxID=3363903 RepID=UPI0037B7DA67